MRIFNVLMAVVVAFVLLQNPASATMYGTVDATVGAGYALTMSSMIQPYDASWYTGHTGLFLLTYSNMNPSDMGLLPDAFCVETQTVGFGGTYSYSVKDAFDVPVPLGPADTGQGPIGLVKADYLRELFGRFYGQVNSNVTGAAFALAVYEIVFEDLYVQTPPGWDVLSGKFKALAAAGDITLAINQANAWLGDVDGTGPMANLRGLTSTSNQDYIVLVPEPTTICMFGLGSLLLYRRRA